VLPGVPARCSRRQWLPTPLLGDPQGPSMIVLGERRQGVVAVSVPCTRRSARSVTPSHGHRRAPQCPLHECRTGAATVRQQITCTVVVAGKTAAARRRRREVATTSCAPGCGRGRTTRCSTTPPPYRTTPSEISMVTQRCTPCAATSGFGCVDMPDIGGIDRS
jgi:hypothetical protein